MLLLPGPTLMALASFLLFAIVEERDLDPATGVNGALEFTVGVINTNTSNTFELNQSVGRDA